MTFEHEEALIEDFRRTVGLCQFCHEGVDPENEDGFVVIPEAQKARPRKIAHTECYQRNMESARRRKPTAMWRRV